MDSTTDLAPSRVLTFQGIHNFRDHGGYAARGGTLRRGCLYRSAQHANATDDDLAGLDRLGLAAVIDLRSDKERAVSPSRHPAGFAARVLFVPDSVMQAAPHVEAARGVTDPESAAARMVAGYAAMAFTPVFMQGIARYFEALAELDGPTLIHCMAGKDRTGIAVAVLHRALGVAREDWLADYLMTNVTGNIDARIAAGATHVRAAFGRELDDDTVRVLMTVRPEFIDSCFDTMDRHHGGLDGYLAACGVMETTLARVRDRLIV
ncbi:MAG: tyrosine-protein phosphatase [Novosphingobium sp.]|nr:tyrosine-protein phosphatase [Novosphingobium sp.]